MTALYVTQDRTGAAMLRFATDSALGGPNPAVVYDAELTRSLILTRDVLSSGERAAWAFLCDLASVEGVTYGLAAKCDEGTQQAAVEALAVALGCVSEVTC